MSLDITFCGRTKDCKKGDECLRNPKRAKGHPNLEMMNFEECFETDANVAILQQ